MLRRFVRSTIVGIFPFIAVAALAAEGRTPVFAPGTFLGRGREYIVTRNLAGGAGAVITIGAPNVDLDLNGFLLTGPEVGDLRRRRASITSPSATASGGRNRRHRSDGDRLRKIDIEDVKIHNPTDAGDSPGRRRRERRCAATRSRTRPPRASSGTVPDS